MDFHNVLEQHSSTASCQAGSVAHGALACPVTPPIVGRLPMHTASATQSGLAWC